MDPLILVAFASVLVLYLWAASSGRKLQAQIARIRKIHWPDAKIGYMDVKGKRYTFQISIESVRPLKGDFLVTAWCHEKKKFLTIHASRIYEYVDLNRLQEIKNVPAYFTEKFSKRG